MQIGRPVREAFGQPTPTPPEGAPEIIRREHPSGISVYGEWLQVPNAECGHLIEDALRQNQEVEVADDFCRILMRRALEIQRNAPPVETRQAVGGETPVPTTILVAGVPLEAPSEACANLIAQALQENQEIAVTDEGCRAKMREALEIQSNPPPAGAPAQQPMPGTSAPLAKFLPNSQ